MAFESSRNERAKVGVSAREIAQTPVRVINRVTRTETGRKAADDAAVPQSHDAQQSTASVIPQGIEPGVENPAPETPELLFFLLAPICVRENMDASRIFTAPHRFRPEPTWIRCHQKKPSRARCACRPSD
jgi:hypothetical protein